MAHIYFNKFPVICVFQSLYIIRDEKPAKFLPRCMHCMQRGLAVCPSVCQTRDLWQNERKSRPHSYTTWNNVYPSFGKKKNGW